MKFSIPESMASSCVSLLQWSWNYLHGNHFSGVQTRFSVLDRTMSNVVYTRIQKTLLSTHYFSAALTELIRSYFGTSLTAFILLFLFSTTSMSLQLLLFRSQYLTPGIILHNLRCFYIRGSAFCVIPLLQAVPTQSVAHRTAPPSAARLVLPTQLTRKKCGMPLIILIPLCSKNAAFFLSVIQSRSPIFTLSFLRLVYRHPCFYFPTIRWPRWKLGSS